MPDELQIALDDVMAKIKSMEPTANLIETEDNNVEFVVLGEYQLEKPVSRHVMFTFLLGFLRGLATRQLKTAVLKAELDELKAMK